MGRIDGQDFLIRALHHGKPIAITIQGDCMHPLLQHGQRVSVQPVADIRAGDVVLYRDPSGRYLAHRVLDVEGSAVITAGDRNMLTDPPIRREDILGRLDMPQDDWRGLPEEQMSRPTLFVPPNLLDEAQLKAFHRDFALTIRREPDPVARLSDMRARGCRTVVIHPGARTYLSELPDEDGELIFFMGYEVGKRTDEHTRTIGVHDVTVVARTTARYWGDQPVAATIGYLAGYGLRRRTVPCHG